MKLRTIVLALSVSMAAVTVQAHTCRIETLTASAKRVVGTNDRIFKAIYKNRAGYGLSILACPDQDRPRMRLFSEDQDRFIGFDGRIDPDGFLRLAKDLTPGIYRVDLWTTQTDRDAAGHRITRTITGSRRIRLK